MAAASALPAAVPAPRPPAPAPGPATAQRTAVLPSDRARPALSTDSPSHTVAATRQAPRAIPPPAPASGPKATPAAKTPTSGQTDPSDCDVEKAWPRPKTHPSNT